MTNRREFLTQLGLAAAAVAVVACGKGGGGAGGDACSDVSKLSDAEKATRTTNNYVDKSADAAKVCSGCALYEAPAAGAACGACKVIKGPISPGGGCNLFAPKA